MSAGAAPTWRALLDEAVPALRAAGLDAPRDEALRLAAATIGVTAGALRLRHEEAVTDADAVARYRRAVARRAGGEPLAYVTGTAGFRRLELRSDRRALIPRPETELLVDLVLARAPTGILADVGTGTGCLALSFALEGRYRRVLATDRSDEALSLAAENVARSTTPDVRLVRGDLTTMLADAALDVLVSNPPYLTEDEWATLDPSVKAWEPRLALPSGIDGLETIGRLLDDGRRVLRAGGLLALELDCRRAQETAARARHLGWTDVAVHHDLFGRERFLLARKE